MLQVLRLSQHVSFLHETEEIHSEVVLENVTYTLTFTFEEYTRDNQNYLLVVDTQLKMAPRAMSGRYDNLFKDKALNDAFSREMSADWKKPFGHFSSIYFDRYAKGYGNVFNRFVSKTCLKVTLRTLYYSRVCKFILISP
jgi:hypothetical protein